MGNTLSWGSLLPTPQGVMDTMNFWLPTVVVFSGNFLFFFWCQYKKDNSWIDAFWGLSFLFPNLALVIKRYADSGSVNPDIRCWVIVGLIAVWSMRLSIHIGLRHKGEDYRYVDMRRDWMAKGGYSGYLWRAFVYIFMLQAGFSLICNSAALYVNIYSNSTYLIWLDWVGMAVWAFGFGFEVIGDYQLKTHIADKTPGKKKFINSGLWRFTRHPNYFGEAVSWWGIYLIACGIEKGWATFFAPIFITLMVRFVSGVPLLEKKYTGNPEWEAYCQQVNVFVPWFPTKRSQTQLESGVLSIEPAD